MGEHVKVVTMMKMALMQKEYIKREKYIAGYDCFGYDSLGCNKEG